MKILITGFSGFVGNQVAKALKAQGHSLRILLNKHTITRREYKTWGDIEIVWGTFHKPEIVQKALEGIDVVVHSGWSFSPPNVVRPTVNEQGTRLLFEESVKAGVKKFIFLSSIAVYGMQSQREETISEQSAFATGEQADFIYAAEKISTERWLQEQDTSKMPLIMYRPGPIFDENKGPIKGGIIKLGPWHIGLNIGTGKNQIPYVHVKDVANAIALGVENLNTSTTLNIVPSEELTLKNWIRVWGRFKGVNLHPVLLPTSLMKVVNVGVKFLKKMLGKSGDIQYVIATSTCDMLYTNEKLKQELTWNDDVTLRYTKLI